MARSGTHTPQARSPTPRHVGAVVVPHPYPPGQPGVRHQPKGQPETTANPTPPHKEDAGFTDQEGTLVQSLSVLVRDHTASEETRIGRTYGGEVVIIASPQAADAYASVLESTRDGGLVDDAREIRRHLAQIEAEAERDDEDGWDL